MKKIKINKNYGILFFITGLSGSGKTSISTKLVKNITHKYGKTLLLTGEKIRDIYNFSGFTKEDRLKLGIQNIKLINLILKQRINVIYDAVALLKELRIQKKKIINNYLEIFIKTDVSAIIKFNKKKKIYKEIKTNIMGVHIKPDFPKNPHITINNNFRKNILSLTTELEKKISEILVN